MKRKTKLQTAFTTANLFWIQQSPIETECEVLRGGSKSPTLMHASALFIVVVVVAAVVVVMVVAAAAVVMVMVAVAVAAAMIIIMMLMRIDIHLQLQNEWRCCERQMTVE